MVWITMSLYGVIGYHVTVSEGHMIANHPIYAGNLWSCDPLRGSHDSQSPHIRKHLCPHLVATLIYLSQMYSYYIRGDRSHINNTSSPYWVNFEAYIYTNNIPRPNRANSEGCFLYFPKTYQVIIEEDLKVMFVLLSITFSKWFNYKDYYLYFIVLTVFWGADCGETAVITLGGITGCFCAWSSSANVFWIRVRTRSTPTIHGCNDTTILNFITFLVMSTHPRVVISLYKPSAQGVKVTASVALILTSTWWHTIKELDRWCMLKKNYISHRIARIIECIH